MTQDNFFGLQPGVVYTISVTATIFAMSPGNPGTEDVSIDLFEITQITGKSQLIKFFGLC